MNQTLTLPDTSSDRITQAKPLKRDCFIDFLRAFGLLLLVVAHTNAPGWLATIRVFDVPLMIFISAYCYKSLTGGVVTYLIKRFKRIYYPVFIFLSLFFSLVAVYSIITGNYPFSILQIIGSYLLFYPSIGYVWIMRVFLIIACILPILDLLMKQYSTKSIGILMVGLILLQPILIHLVNAIPSRIISLIIERTVIYTLGYTPIAILGLTIRRFSTKDLWLSLFILAAAILIFVYTHNMEFNPQAYKYPPQSLYVVYGMFWCILLWMIKPVVQQYVTWRGFNYLSKHSMWIYLWHIIPIYALVPLSNNLPNIWGLRFIIVLSTALLLNYVWTIFNTKVRPLLGWIHR